MKRYGFWPAIRTTCPRAHSDGSVFAVCAFLLAYLLFLPWFPGTTFGPSHSANDLDFSALRGKVHLSARNESRHLRDADRDDDKGGPPPNDIPVVLVEVLPISPPRRAVPQSGWEHTTLAHSSYRSTHQPRAPPLQHL